VAAINQQRSLNYLCAFARINALTQDLLAGLLELCNTLSSDGRAAGVVQQPLIGWNTPHHTCVCCRVLQPIKGSSAMLLLLYHTTAHYSAMQHTATYCNTLQHTLRAVPAREMLETLEIGRDGRDGRHLSSISS